MNQEPYITRLKILTIRLYNPDFGDDRTCECGHPYHRHFDGYEDEEDQAVGCKYCGCYTFKEIAEDECFGVIDSNYKIIDKSASRNRAESRKWEIEDEHPDYKGQKLDLTRCKWNDTHGLPLNEL